MESEAEVNGTLDEVTESEIGTDGVERETLLEMVEPVALVEALLLASGEPLSAERLSEVTGLTDEQVQQSLQELIERYTPEVRGFELVAVAEKYQLRTKPVFAPFVRELKSGRPRRLSAQALETLAVVAYRQPIVKSDIEKIRGVDATPTLKTLLDRRLLRIVGHQASVGQPALYGTTEDFLKIFGLRSLSELPTLQDLREIESDPGEPEEEAESPESGGAEPMVENV